MPSVHSTPSKFTSDDILAMNILAPLLDGYVAWNQWSMKPSALVSLVNLIVLRQRRLVVELGSGPSTIFLAAAMQRYGGRLLSVEHDPAWAEYTSRELDRHGLSAAASVVVAPLTAYTADEVADEPYLLPDLWYDREILATALPDGIDLLIVDGPPGGEDPRMLAREPAARELKGKLATDYVVALDDLDREPERAILARWERELGIGFIIFEGHHIGLGNSIPGVWPIL